MKLPVELLAVQENIQVLRDRVLVKPLPYKHPTLVLPTVKTQTGLVVAIGKGHRERRKVGFTQKMPDRMPGKFNSPHAMSSRTQYFEDGDETGRVRAMQVVPGDVVEFSFRNLETVDFDRLGFSGVGELVFVWEKAIYCYAENQQPVDSLLWQQSAGYDRNGNFLSGAENWHAQS